MLVVRISGTHIEMLWMIVTFIPNSYTNILFIDNGLIYSKLGGREIVPLSMGALPKYLKSPDLSNLLQ